MDNNTIRISMLGGAGSGKTSFFSGIIQSMIVNALIIGKGEERSSISLNVVSVKQSQSFFLDDDNPENLVRTISNAALLTGYLITNDPDATNGGFHDTTTDSVEFTFDLVINNIPCCKIIIADYAGELIDNPNNEAMRGNLAQLCSNIAESDALIIMADSVIISQNLGNNYAIQRETGAQIINIIFPAIKNTIAEKNKSLTTVIALTKTDSITLPDGMKASNFAGISDILFHNTYRRLFACLDENNDSWGIIPVSAVGQGNVDEYNCVKENADITPENIDTAIVFAIASSLTNILSDKEAHLRQLENEYKGVRFSIGTQAKQTRESLKKQIEELEKQKIAIENCHNAIATMNDSFAKKINNMHRSGIAELDAVVDG